MFWVYRNINKRYVVMQVSCAVVGLYLGDGLTAVSMHEQLQPFKSMDFSSPACLVMCIVMQMPLIDRSMLRRQHA